MFSSQLRRVHYCYLHGDGFNIVVDIPHSLIPSSWLPCCECHKLQFCLCMQRYTKKSSTGNLHSFVLGGVLHGLGMMSEAIMSLVCAGMDIDLYDLHVLRSRVIWYGT